MRWDFQAAPMFTPEPAVNPLQCAEGVADSIVYRLTYNDDIVAFKMDRRQGARRAHI